MQLHTGVNHVDFATFQQWYASSKVSQPWHREVTTTEDAILLNEQWFVFWMKASAELQMPLGTNVHAQRMHTATLVPR